MKIIEVITVIILLIILLGVLKIVFLDNKKDKNIKNDNNNNKNRYSKKHINELSFLKFAKFYGYTYPKNKDFYKHINNVLNSINNMKIKNIEEISNNDKCDKEYIFMLIRYLKNKRLIGDLSINKNSYELIESTIEEKDLINKYSKFIYASHLQIEDMIPLLSNKDTNTDITKDIIKEIAYLDKKYLLNGIRLNIEENKIIYYSVEKKKIEKAGIEIAPCPKCGAITYKKKDVITFTCDYCKSTIEKKVKGNKKEN